MIMASIVLSPRESFLQVTFALILIGIMTFSEYAGLLPHFPLEGFISHDLYKNRIYLLVTGIIFVTTSYLVVYITNSIVIQSRRNEEAYLKANKELKKKDEIKNEYVLRITHDIKGHLAAIHSNLSVLQSRPEGSIGQDSKEFLDRAVRRTSTLIRFIRDLLYITKLKQSGELGSARFSLRESIQKILINLEPQAGKKSIRMHVDLGGDVDQVTGFQLSIEELITNLLGNAIQYSDNGSDVHLVVKKWEKQILVEVQDTGPGISPQEQDLVFEEFYRGSNTRDDTEGTGLGLAIARKIVHTHGGRIWIESAEGRGSKFCFTLPMEPESPA
jgi:signal transduction histidine kinase